MQNFFNTLQGKRFILAEIGLLVITIMEEIDFYIKIFSGLAAIIVAVFAVISYVAKTKLSRTENKIKLLELERKELEWWEEQERKNKLK
jgi:hypothetical protein